GKPCVLDEPCGRDLHAPVRRKRGDLLPALREVGEGGGRQHRIGEERAGRARVRVRRIEHHGLTAPQREHGLSHQTHRLACWNRVEGAEVRHGTLQLGITDSWLLVPSEPQRDLEHDIAIPIRALEPAVPIPEGTFPCGEGPALERGPIETHDAHQTLGDLLPVGAHVLYRRAADRPGDPRQALDSGPAACHYGLHQPVPIHPGAGADLGALPVTELHPADGDAQDESGKPRVEKDDIAAAAQHVHRQTPVGGEGERRADLVLGAALDEVTGLSSEPQCRIRGQGHLFAQLHALILHERRPVLRWRYGHSVTGGLHGMYGLSYFSSCWRSAQSPPLPSPANPRRPSDSWSMTSRTSRSSCWM